MLHTADSDDTQSIARALTERIVASADGEADESLSDLSLAILQQDLQTHLDPLAVLSTLVSSPRVGADDMLGVLSQNSSARELAVAVQEVIEYLINVDADEGGDGADVARATSATQFERLVNVYVHAIPRLSTKNSPSRTLMATVAEMQPVIGVVTISATVTESHKLVGTTAQLVQDLYMWVKDKAQEDQAELTRCKVILTAFLDTVLEVSANKLSTSLSQRLFQTRFPRLVVRAMTESEWKAGEDALNAAIHASECMGRTSGTLISTPSIASLILCVHSDALEKQPSETLTTMFPVVLMALQANIALDEALALLLAAFFPTSQNASIEHSPDVIIPLSTLLPALCSAHPDAPTRHLTFRLLGQVLRAAPPPLRLQMLRDLLAPSEDAFPQMRVAAIGLARDAVIEGLAGDSRAAIFASPIMLATLGPFVLRSDPADLFKKDLTAEDFMEMDEAKRLIECLAFYYVLLSRDADNKTGIRDPSTVREVETSLLDPLRNALRAWLTDARGSNDPHTLLPLAALQTNIGRIDEALAKVSS